MEKIPLFHITESIKPSTSVPHVSARTNTLWEEDWAESYKAQKTWNAKKVCLDSANYHKPVNSTMLPKSTLDTLNCILKDESYVVVVQSAIRIISHLNASYCGPNAWKNLMTQLLYKFKERKLEDDINECLLAIHSSIKISDMVPSIKSMFTCEKSNSSNPNLKKCISKWISHQMLLHPYSIKSHEAAIICDLFNVFSSDSNSEVREESLKALGILRATSDVKMENVICALSPLKKSILNHAYTETLSKGQSVQYLKPTDFSMRLSSHKGSEHSEDIIKQANDILKANINLCHKEEQPVVISTIEHLTEEISKNKLDSSMQEHTLKKLTKILNESSNEEVLQALNLISRMLDASDIKEELAKNLLPSIMKKITYISFNSIAEEIIMKMCDTVGPLVVTSELLEATGGFTADDVITETFSILLRIIESYNLKLLSINIIIQFCKDHLNHNKYRQWVIRIYKAMYAELGVFLLLTLYMEKEETILQVYSEFSKIPAIQPPKKYRKLRSNAQKEMELIENRNILDIAFPIQTISISYDTIEQFTSSESQVVISSINLLCGTILKHNARVYITNMFELMNAFNSCNFDSLVMIEVVNLMVALGKSIGSELRKYSDILLNILVSGLGNIDNSIADQCYDSLVYYCSILGPNNIFCYLSEALLKEDANTKMQAIKWLINEYPRLTNCDYGKIVLGIVNCLHDSSSLLQDAAKKLIGRLASHLNIEVFIAESEKLADNRELTKSHIIQGYFNSANTNYTTHSIEPFGNIELHLISRMLVHYARASSICSSPSSVAASPMQASKFLESSQEVTFPKWTEPSNQASSESRITNINIKKKYAMALHTRITINKKSHTNLSRTRKLESSLRTEIKSSDSKMSQHSAKVQSTREQFNTLAPFSIFFKDKQKRMSQEIQVCPSIDSRTEYLEFIKKCTKPLTNASLFNAMYFEKDFSKITECINTLGLMLGTKFNEVFSVLDLILKWIAYSNFDSNTSIQKAIVDFIAVLYAQIRETRNTLCDVEISALVSIFSRYVGSSNTYIRTKSRELLIDAAELVDPHKITPCIIKILKTNSTKLKEECMDIIYALVKKYNTDIISDKDLNTIANSLSNKDVSLKAILLKIIMEVMQLEGANIWQRIGTISEQTIKEINDKKAEIIKVKSINKKMDEAMSSKYNVKATKHNHSSRTHSNSVSKKDNISFTPDTGPFCFTKTANPKIVYKEPKTDPRSNSTKLLLRTGMYSKITAKYCSNENSGDDSFKEIFHCEPTKVASDSYIKQSQRLQRNSNIRSSIEKNKVAYATAGITQAKSTFDFESNSDPIAFASYIIANPNSNILQITIKLIKMLQNEISIIETETMLDSYCRYQKINTLMDSSICETLIKELLIKIEESCKESKVIADCFDAVVGNAPIVLVCYTLLKILSNQEKHRVIIQKCFKKLTRNLTNANAYLILKEINMLIETMPIVSSVLFMIKPFIVECSKHMSDQELIKLKTGGLKEPLQYYIEETMLLQSDAFVLLVKNFTTLTKEQIYSKLKELLLEAWGISIERAFTVYMKVAMISDESPSSCSKKACETTENFSDRYQRLSDKILQLKESGVL